MKAWLSLILTVFLLPSFSLAAPKKTSTPKKIEVKLLKVVTTLSVLQALVKDLGGNLVEVASLSSASEDPHFVKAKPTFKQKVSEADLFIEIGRSLELWVPQVIGSSGNQKLTGNGLLYASAGVKSLEIPETLSRKEGDIHPEGNPHVWLSPLAALKMSENIKNALIAKDPANKAIYEKNFLAFKTKLATALFGMPLVKAAGSMDFLFRLHEGKKLKDYMKKRPNLLGGWVKLSSEIDYPFLTYHSVWSYLADEFGLTVFADIEEKPGLPPSLRYQNELIKKLQENSVRHIVAASYYRGYQKLIDLIAQKITGKTLFIDVDSRPGESYIDMMNRILSGLADFKVLPANNQIILPKRRG
jgi:zinc/manganese transport system substrate-binding protein